MCVFKCEHLCARRSEDNLWLVLIPPCETSVDHTVYAALATQRKFHACKAVTYHLSQTLISLPPLP